MKSIRSIAILFWVGLAPFAAWAQSIGIIGDSIISQCETKSYTISIQNNSGEAMSNLVVVARMENLSGFAYISGAASIDVNGGSAFCTADPVVDDGYSGDCAPAPGSPYATWDIDAQCPGSPFTLADGDTLDIAFSMETDCQAVSGSLNTYVDYTLPGPVSMCDDSGVLDIQVNQGAISINKTPNVIPQVPGQDATYTLIVENTGFGVVKNVEVTDVLGAGLAYVSSTQNGNNNGQTTTWTSNEYPALASMAPGEILTMDITATVIACDDLDSTADVRFGCSSSPADTCFDTATDGGTARASVANIVRTPNLQFDPPDIDFAYCGDTESFSFTIENIGDGPAYDVYTIVDFGGVSVSNVSAGAIYDDADKRFELAAPLAASGDPGDSYIVSFDLAFADWCGSFPSGDLLWQGWYKDECDQDFYQPSELSTIGVPADASGLSLSQGVVSGLDTIQIGDTVSYDIVSSYSGLATCDSPSNNAGVINVVDTVPDGFTVTDAGGGAWTPGADGTGGAITWIYTPPASLNTTVTFQSPGVADCETYCNTTFTNSIMASGTDCCSCTLSAGDSVSTAIECAENLNSEKSAAPATGERCGQIKYTNTYTFEDIAGNDSIRVSSMVFTEQAEREQEYSGGSLSVTIEDLSGGGPVDATACANTGITDTTPGAGGTFQVDFSGCGSFGTVRNKEITIAYTLDIIEDTVAACDELSFYSWSELDVGPTGSDCLADGIIYETTLVEIEPPAMSVSINNMNPTLHTCEAQSIDIELTQTSTNTDAKDVRLVLSGSNYFVTDPETVTGVGVTPVTGNFVPTISGNDYVWEFGDNFSSASPATSITLDVQKRCTADGELEAIVYFDDSCNDQDSPDVYDDSCSITAFAEPSLLLGGELLIEKAPETYYAVTNTVQWEIYVTNRGTGTAYNVWVDDVLGSGLLYENGVNPVVVDDMTGVSINDSLDHDGGAINGASVEIASMAAGERRQITFVARQIDCNNLTNNVTASWGCDGTDCQTAVSDSAIVTVPAPNLINTTTITPAGVDACSSPEGFIILRNAGQATVYNLQATETLPPDLLYVSGSTRWRLNGGAWNGPDFAYDPDPTDSPLVWTSSEIPALASANPGDVIEIRFGMASDCPFGGGDITLSTRFENPCGDVFNAADSTFSVAFNAPEIVIEKTRADDPIGCNEAIQWTITVTNNSGYTLPIIWVEDTMDAAFTYASSEGDPPYTSDNGTNAGQVTTWELRNVNPGDTVTLTLNATTDSAPCSPDLDTTVIAYWGCGSADGSSATKPGVNAPDDDLCLISTVVEDVRTETRRPDLGFLSIDMNPRQIEACNDSTTLTIVMENKGPVDAYDIDLAITLPSGITYNAGTSESGLGTDETLITSSIGDPAVSGNTITFYDFGDKTGNLANAVQAAGGNDTLVLRFTVQSACFVTDDAAFDLRFYDCCSDNQYSETTSWTIASDFPELAVDKTADFSQVDCGENVQYTITVTNNGTGNAEVIRVVDTLGDWLDFNGGSFVDLDGTGAVWFFIGGDPQTAGWEFNNLEAGATATFTFEASLNPDGLPNQNDSTIAPRQSNIEVQWACGTAGNAVDYNPNTTGYDCTGSGSATAGPATLAMPDLVVSSIAPDIGCTGDGTFGNDSITVRVANNGDGDTSGAFTVEVTDGKGWTGTGTYDVSIADGAFAEVAIDTSSWEPACQSCATPYRFNATVDLNNDICEYDESNNATGSDTIIDTAPDLSVTDIDFTNVSCTDDGISGSVMVEVANSGCSDASNVLVRLQSACGLTFGDQTVALIAAGSTTAADFTISGTWSDCSLTGCEFTAIVDPAQAVCECDGTNNQRVETYGSNLPDLIIGEIDFDLACSGDGISGDVEVTVENQGGGDAAAFRVALESADCFANPVDVEVSSLAAGESTTVTFNMTDAWANCSDPCEFTATVDADNVVCECDGTNNSRTESSDFFQSRLYWSDATLTEIQRADFDGGPSESVAAAADGLDAPWGMAVDAGAAKIYWVNHAAGTIQRADLDGANVETLLSGLNAPVDIALDAVGGKIYWTDDGDNILARAGLDGTNPETLVENLGDAAGLALDLDAGKLYWTNPAGGAIHRADLDGGNAEILIDTGLSAPFGIALDSTGPKIYFTDPGAGKIQRIDPDGTNLEDVIGGLGGAVGLLALDEAGGRIYFGTNDTTVRSVGYDGVGLQDTITGLTEAVGVALFSPAPDYTSVNLAVTSVAASDSCSDDQNSVWVAVGVSNTGTTDVQGAVVRVASDCGIVFADQTVDLSAGENMNLFFDYDNACDGCACNFTATIDPDDEICECDGADNAGTAALNRDTFDLLISDIDFANLYCDNDGIGGSIGVAVENRGCAEAVDFEVALGTDGCLSFASQTVASLAANASTELTFAVTGPWADCTLENCLFTATVDGADTVCECDGTNNDRSESYANPLPDLIVSAIDTDGINFTGDGVLSGNVTVTVQNQGFGAPALFDVSLTAEGSLTFADQTVSGPLAAGASTTVVFPVDGFWNEGSDCGLDFAAVVDSGGAVCECESDNNTLSATYASTPPNLAVNSVIPTFACRAYDSATGTVAVNVSNDNCQDINGAVVRVSTADCSAVIPDQSVDLMRGQNPDLLFNFTPASSDCNCTFTAEIDPDDTIRETTGDDNTATAAPLQIDLPDLAVAAIDFTDMDCSGDTVSGSVAVTVANEGCIAAANFDVALDTDGCLTFADQTVSSLAAGASTTLAFNIADGWADCAAADCTFTARVDAGDAVCERAAVNNIHTENYRSSLPDLVVSAIDTDGINFANDGALSGNVIVTVQNQGFGAPALFDVSLTADGSLTFSDQTVSGPLAAGASTAVVFPVDGFWDDGADCGWDFVAVVDSGNAVCECEGDNNTFSATYASTLPNLAVNSVVPAFACNPNGLATGTVVVNVANKGCQDIIGAAVRVSTADCSVAIPDQSVDLIRGQNADLLFNFIPGSSDCNCTFTAEIDPDGAISESTGADNALTATPLAIDVPDVAVAVVDFTDLVCAGDDLAGNVVVHVQNQGCAAADAFEVSLEAEGLPVSEDQTVPLLAPGETATLVYPITGYPSTVEDRMYLFTASADQTNPSCEFSADNNSATQSLTPALPDLTVREVVPDFTDENQFVRVEVANAGAGDALGARVQLVSDCGMTFPEKTIDLATGASRDLFFEPHALPPDVARCIFTATIDPVDAICEFHGLDNVLDSVPYVVPSYCIPTLGPWGVWILLGLVLVTALWRLGPSGRQG